MLSQRGLREPSMRWRGLKAALVFIQEMVLASDEGVSLVRLRTAS